MRNVVAIAISLAVSTMFSGCDDNNESNNPKVPEGGVLINGIVWAKCNVDAPGIFADNPEDAGMFYQWNSQVAWPATGDNVPGWNSNPPTGTTWEKSNDPSPVGWRIPTKEEFRKLLDKEKVTSKWTTENGVKGREFTDMTTGNSIFLPAAGIRHAETGKFYGSVGELAMYLSSNRSGDTDNYMLYFHYEGVLMADDDGESDGCSIRCVAK